LRQNIISQQDVSSARIINFYDDKPTGIANFRIERRTEENLKNV
jgi:hypothetical protein